MAQSDFAEKLETYEMQVEYTDVMTGDKNRKRFLYYQLKMSMLKADRIDIIVSFLMESGVRMILNDLKSALDRGVKVRILTGKQCSHEYTAGCYTCTYATDDADDTGKCRTKERFRYGGDRACRCSIRGNVSIVCSGKIRSR